MPIPDALKNAARPKPDEIFYWNAFLELGTERDQPRQLIRWSAIDAYARRHPVGHPEAFRIIIRALDSHLLDRTKPNADTRSPS